MKEKAAVCRKEGKESIHGHDAMTGAMNKSFF